jgi:lysophospholipase L1-like esterase
MKLFTTALALILAISSLSSCAAVPDNMGEKASKPLEYLQNTYYRLTNDKKLNIVYVGGSVTDGYGASDQNTKSWRHLTTEWFREKFPEARIAETKASIGGTGSYFADFRYEREIKPHNPDLLFIEFAINDHYGNISYDNVVNTSETLVRKAYEDNPYIDIIYVLVFDEQVADSDYLQLTAHRDVADKYGLMSIKMSDYFYQMLKKTKGNYQDYFSDGVHPNDNGYAYFASVITDRIGRDILLEDGMNTQGITLKKAVIPEKSLSKKPLLLDARMIYSDEIEMKNANGWEHQKTNFSWLGTRYNGRLFASSVGSSFEFDFEGTDLGICYGIGPNRGIITCTVDGENPVVINACTPNTNPCENSIASGLEKGKHTVKIELTGASPDGAGNFEIGAFLVN